MSRLRLFTPIYLLLSQTKCYRCGRMSPVAAMAAETFAEIADEKGPAIAAASDEPIIVHDVTELPPELLAAVRAIQPFYEKRLSRTAGCEYFMNVCCHCRAHFGDFYLHCEPDGPFFPIEEEDVQAVQVRPLPLAGPLDLVAGYGRGTGREILAKGQRVG